MCATVRTCLRGGCAGRYVTEALPGANKPQWCNHRPAGAPEGKEGKCKHILGLSLAHHKQALHRAAIPVLRSQHLKPCGLAWKGVIMETEAKGQDQEESPARSPWVFLGLP